ncbi:hypothetical protein TNCV_2408571 [Trichonephila clavipes]|nr:hypothetical protein TNCV_2408571 [Trichonephila clavipes]
MSTCPDKVVTLKRDLQCLSLQIASSTYVCPTYIPRLKQTREGRGKFPEPRNRLACLEIEYASSFQRGLSERMERMEREVGKLKWSATLPQKCKQTLNESGPAPATSKPFWSTERSGPLFGKFTMCAVCGWCMVSVIVLR